MIFTLFLIGAHYRLSHSIHRRCPNDSKNRTSVEDQLMIVELRLYKTPKIKKNKRNCPENNSDMAILNKTERY